MILFFLSAVPVTAMEALLGRISSVNPDKGEILLDIKNFQKENGVENKRKNTIKITFKKKDLPEEIYKGALIKVWGDFHNGESSGFFAAKKIVPVGEIGRHDPTGVRHRLRRGRQMGGKGFGGRHGRHNKR